MFVHCHYHSRTSLQAISEPQPLYSNPHSGSPKTSGRAYSKVDGQRDSGIPSVFYSSTQFQRSNLLGSMRYTFPKQP